MASLVDRPVLVDTSFWIEYFNRPGTERAISVENLIRDDSAALTGVVLAELLRGAQSDEEFSELRSALGAIRWIETTGDIYTRAGRLAFELRRVGITVPTTDCVIASAAESMGGRILTLDKNFEDLTRVVSLELLTA